ncbi:sensor histidine kinase [Streptomyces sp. NPDC055239]
MSALVPVPLLRRVRPETWAVVLWGATTVFALLDKFYRLPGEATYDGQPLPTFSLPFIGWMVLVVIAGLVVAGSRLLRARPLTGYALFLLGPALTAGLLGMSEFELVPFLAPAFALHCVALGHPRRTSAVAASFALLLLLFPVAVRLAMSANIDTAQLLAVALTVLVAWLVGDSTHQARAHAAVLRAKTATQAITDERLRIAREMHDTVAHSVGIIALQAGAAARVVETQPANAREAMLAVESAGRETLSGLRRMLGALREADLADRDGKATDSGQARVAQLRPAEGLADVDRLAGTTTAAGVRVGVCWKGRRRALPVDLDLAAFRIIQESVTNVVRHSGADSCRVDVDFREGELAIEVRDRGRGGEPGPGYGVAGMRERIALLHGQFSAAPCPDGGFRVTARLPLPTSPSLPTGD